MKEIIEYYYRGEGNVHYWHYKIGGWISTSSSVYIILQDMYSCVTFSITLKNDINDVMEIFSIMKLCFQSLQLRNKMKTEKDNETILQWSIDKYVETEQRTFIKCGISTGLARSGELAELVNWLDWQKRFGCPEKYPSLYMIWHFTFY